MHTAVFSILSQERMIANMRLRHLSQNEQDPYGEARWLEYYRNRGYMVQQPEREKYTNQVAIEKKSSKAIPLVFPLR